MPRKKQKRNVYSWKPNYYYHRNVDPQVVGEELERLKQANGNKIDPEQVVESAEDLSSPLHQCFEWDDAVAGHQWRVHNCRVMMSALRIVSSDRKLEHRAFVHVVSHKTRGYMAVVDAMSDEESKKYVLQKALEELRSFRQRYKELDELAQVLAVIDEVAA